MNTRDQQTIESRFSSVSEKLVILQELHSSLSSSRWVTNALMLGCQGAYNEIVTTMSLAGHNKIDDCLKDILLTKETKIKIISIIEEVLQKLGVLLENEKQHFPLDDDSESMKLILEKMKKLSETAPLVQSSQNSMPVISTVPAQAHTISSHAGSSQGFPHQNKKQAILGQISQNSFYLFSSAPYVPPEKRKQQKKHSAHSHERSSNPLFPNKYSQRLHLPKRVIKGKQRQKVSPLPITPPDELLREFNKKK